MVRPPQNGCRDLKRYQKRNCVQKIGSQAHSYVENGPNEDFRFFDFGESHNVMGFTFVLKKSKN